MQFVSWHHIIPLSASFIPQQRAGFLIPAQHATSDLPLCEVCELQLEVKHKIGESKGFVGVLGIAIQLYTGSRNAGHAKSMDNTCSAQCILSSVSIYIRSLIIPILCSRVKLISLPLLTWVILGLFIALRQESFRALGTMEHGSHCPTSSSIPLTTTSPYKNIVVTHKGPGVTSVITAQIVGLSQGLLLQWGCRKE
ncbi:hypothetical protein BT96DRAFT_442846 [Gymnopus androsaceus JB14]|uniref:Uncharacterized protein n=1 Tax=Gymnopus androsaceus JB14 TaxID=1447944 RepID=A0A6A4GSR4_9AGAR|nr:hypothetical protein BT96DRAFT_442846 [Gymnopus androsaceus JB14]